MFGFRYPAVILLAGAVTGTVLGREIDFGLPVIVVVLILSGCFLVYGFLRLPPARFVFPLVLLVVVAAALNANKTYRSFPVDDIGRYAGNDMKLRCFGKIEKWPLLKRHKTILACQIDSVVVDQYVESASGTVLIEIKRETTHFALGDHISFSGQLRKPYGGGYPGQFDYLRYLQNRGIRGLVTINDPAYIMVSSTGSSLIWRSIKSVRLWIISAFQKNLSDLSAALASGFLIGETRDIPDEVYRAFRRTGTMHLLAVSGSNVALVLAVIIVLLRYIPMSRIIRFWFLLAVIVIFSHLSYNQPSVVRASIMAALILAARACHRRADLHNIIAAAAVILIFYDPGNLYDIGFQLSFAVTWGLILFLPHINRLIADKKISKPSRYLLLILFSSLIATLISAPITVYYFGEVSLVTAVSNLLVVPLVSLAVIGIAVLLLTNLILPAAAILPGAFLNLLLELIHGLVLWFDKWKFAAVGTSMVSGDYVLAFLAAVTIIIPAFSNRFMRRILAVYIVAAGGYFLAGFVFAAPPPVADIEVYNLATVQTIVINRGEGIAIFYPFGRLQDDSFSADLIPYLNRRNLPFPRYFTFIEPRYRTEHRLNLMADKELRPALRPCRGSDDGKKGIYPTVWITGDPGLNRTIDTCSTISTAPGVVIIQLDDWGRLLFADSPEHLNSLNFNKLRQFDYCFVSIRDNTRLAAMAGMEGLENTVILLQQPADEYPLLSEDTGFLATGVRILEPVESTTTLEWPGQDPEKSF